MLPAPFAHFMQRPHHQCNSVRNTSSHRCIQIYINNCEKKEVSMVQTRDQMEWPLQNYRTRHSTGKRKIGRQKKRWEDNIRDRIVSISTSVREQPKTVGDGRSTWQKMVADVSSGAPTTLAVPGHR